MEHRSGPVRSAAAREAILDATARLFARQGYDHLTIEGIAKEAGTSKQTIYRWWPSRGSLIADCLLEGRLIDLDLTVPHTGDIHRDLTTWLDLVLSLLREESGRVLLRSLVGAAAEDADVGGRLGDSLGADTYLAERLDVAVRDGQLPADTPTTDVGHAILGAVILRTLNRKPLDERGIRDLVRFLLR